MKQSLKTKTKKQNIEERLRKIEEFQEVLEQAINGLSETIENILASEFKSNEKLKIIEHSLKTLKSKAEHMDEFTLRICRN